MSARGVVVELGDRSYAVRPGADLLGSIGPATRELLGAGPKKAFLVVDRGVPAAFVEEARASLQAAGFGVGSVELVPTEADKSLATLERLLAAMASFGLQRGDPVVAIGGGIVGDLAGFAAASYQRGTPIVQCPTTLLAMVDASVGGKTGVNLQTDAGLLKNFAGAFHQPRLVLADVRTLASLDERVYRAGLGECLKHGMLSGGFGDEQLGAWTAERADRIAARDQATLIELVTRNVAVKARVVEGDESEQAASGSGGRTLLNLGHTYAHAIETMPGLTPSGDPGDAPLQHGEAVGLGLVAAAAAAEHAGIAPNGFAEGVRAMVAGAGLPTRVGGLGGPGPILARMSRDKKARGGTFRLVLPTEGARARVVDDPGEAVVLAGLDAIRG